ncbi:MAG: hypothetical protein OXC63_02475 [Aestuariivita sp.]|nr:hypothetical protein [Aestuariivita sp.]
MEIVRLKRREVADRHLRLKDSNIGPSAVCRSPEAWAVIERRLAAPGMKNEYVFLSPINPERHFAGD